MFTFVLVREELGLAPQYKKKPQVCGRLVLNRWASMSRNIAKANRADKYFQYCCRWCVLLVGGKETFGPCQGARLNHAESRHWSKVFQLTPRCEGDQEVWAKAVAYRISVIHVPP